MSIKKILIFGLVIVAMFLIQSCLFSGCKKVSLTKEDKEWFNSYYQGDTIVFKSNKNNYHLFRVEKYNYFTDCNKLEIGEYQFESRTIRLFLIRKNRGDKAAMEFSLKKGLNKYSCSMSIYMFDLQNKEDEFIDSNINSCLDSLESITMRRNENAYIIETKSLPKLKYFIWNKKNGLLRYETLEDEIFELSPSPCSRTKTN